MNSALRSPSLLQRITPRAARVLGACSLFSVSSLLVGCEAELANSSMFQNRDNDEDETNGDDPKPELDAGDGGDASLPSPLTPDAATDAATPLLDARAPDAKDAEVDTPKPDAMAMPDPCSDGAKGDAAKQCHEMCTEDCGLGEACTDDEACESGLCDEVCLAAGCANEHLDPNESDIDCGGVCSKGCDDDLWCEIDLDCKSRVCGSDHLCSAARCDDETTNGGEVGVDCGAATECGLCKNGDSCVSGTDCESGACVAKECAPPTCKDDLQNGDETDLNCGGECPACDDDAACRRHSDCESGRCENDGEGNLICHYPECDDKVRNGDESDIDCGGPCDTKCILGKRCKTADDCELHACGKELTSNVLVCLEPSCEDATKNAQETDTDCGGAGECERCAETKDCQEHTDCASNSCDETCLEPTCEDGRQNNDETAADCGGTTCDDRCDAQDACSVPEDCASGFCESDTCAPGGADSVCRSDSSCLSGRCGDDKRCVPSTAPDACRVDEDCGSGACSDEGLCLRAYIDGQCGSDPDCISNNCIDEVCGPGVEGAACQGPEDCASSRCNSQLCAPLDLVVQSNGTFNGTTEIAVDFTLSTGAVTVPWSEVAVLYFFNFTDPPTAKEAAYVDMGQHYQNAGANRRCVGVTNTEWIFVWQSNSGGNIASASTYTIKLNNKLNGTSLALDPTNDYSYRAGAGASSKLVICRKVDERWYHVQGTAPESIPNPCQYVTPDCDEVTCDSME